MDKKLDHQSRSHSTFGPSSMKRIINCPASSYLSQNLPDIPAGPAAQQGSLAHECAEIMLEARLKDEPFPRMKDLPEQYNPEMRRHGITYADYIYGEIEPHLDGPHTWFIEQRVILDGKRDAWGTADFVFLYKEEDKIKLMIIDYKYGTGVQVTSEDNPQLITYALAANFSIGEDKVDEVTCHIVQPRSTHETPPVTYQMADLKEKWLPQIIETIDQILGWGAPGDTPLVEIGKFQNAGTWCQFCKVQKHGKCEPYRVQNQRDLKDIFMKHKDKLIKVGSKKVLPEADAVLIPEETRSFIALNAGAMKSFIDAVKSGVIADHKEGTSIKGSKLIKGSSHRTWIHDKEKIAEGLKELGVERTHNSTEPKLRSLTDIEGEIGKGKIAHLTTTLAPKYKLVSEDDENPATTFEDDRMSLLKKGMKKS